MKVGLGSMAVARRDEKLGSDWVCLGKAAVCRCHRERSLLLQKCFKTLAELSRKGNIFNKASRFAVTFLH